MGDRLAYNLDSPCFLYKPVPIGLARELSMLQVLIVKNS
jgi:hypothetical protein